MMVALASNIIRVTTVPWPKAKMCHQGFFCFFLKCSETVYQFAWLSSWCKALTLLLCVREQQKHEHDSALFSVFKHYSLTVMLIVCH